MSQALYQTHLSGLERVHQGKVRDIYRVDDAHLLIVATDRISAFDVVLPDPIPGKGEVLTHMSNFWFERTVGVVRNHLCERSLEDVVTDPEERQRISQQAVVVQRVQPLPVEAIVRGYLIGSGWRDYREGGKVCGIQLPPGLRQADRLPEPIYTPSTKADVGDHDENIDFGRTVELLGGDMAERVREISLRLYDAAVEHALTRGIIIADTKFEFGISDAGELVLIDEVLTPDSSRFWPADEYQVGMSPPSFDKQYVRDYLESVNWDKRPPAPSLPDEVIGRTAEKYREALRRLTD
ncbi:MAG: phosphoribosylaminoimidazolesuccinocarboxamide synthase [Gammaproteobacteria bacterium]|nr:MAG: phosphoribosylaminoimidazolesuccinocarboxamide synthase [Gammaproteobacteria bacterium]